MRAYVLGFPFIILMSIGTACGKRSEIPHEPWIVEIEREPEASPSSQQHVDMKSEPMTVDVQEPKESEKAANTVPKPKAKPDFMLLKFAHAENLCLAAGADGRTSLQTCSTASDDGKFLAVVALDGRIQYQNVKSKLCIASAGDRFTGFVLQMETCASKASQFFTRIDFDTVFALRQDSENRCVYAENGAKAPGARALMFPCGNDMAQRLRVITLLPTNEKAASLSPSDS